MPSLAVQGFSLASLALWAGLSLLAFARLGLRGAILALVVGGLLTFGRLVVDGRLQGRTMRACAGALYAALALLAAWALVEAEKNELITAVMSLQAAVGVLGVLLVLRRSRLDAHGARILPSRGRAEAGSPPRFG